MNENLAVTSASVTYDNLFVVGSSFPVVIDAVTIASGNSLKRGTVLGIVTASSKAVAVDSSKTTGEQTAYAILANDTDASSADIIAPVYLTGEYNGDALTFGGTDTKTTHKAALRKIGIFIKSAQPA
jgi:hypothetical protein